VTVYVVGRVSILLEVERECKQRDIGVLACYHESSTWRDALRSVAFGPSPARPIQVVAFTPEAFSRNEASAAMFQLDALGVLGPVIIDEADSIVTESATRQALSRAGKWSCLTTYVMMTATLPAVLVRPVLHRYHIENASLLGLNSNDLRTELSLERIVCQSGDSVETRERVLLSKVRERGSCTLLVVRSRKQASDLYKALSVAFGPEHVGLLMRDDPENDVKAPESLAMVTEKIAKRIYSLVVATTIAAQGSNLFAGFSTVVVVDPYSVALVVQIGARALRNRSPDGSFVVVRHGHRFDG
jgi:hypothetical protein